MEDEIFELFAESDFNDTLDEEDVFILDNQNEIQEIEIDSICENLEEEISEKEISIFSDVNDDMSDDEFLNDDLEAETEDFADVSYGSKMRCSLCNGSGFTSPSSVFACPWCHGTGLR